MKTRFPGVLALVVFCLASSVSNAVEHASRERLLMDFGWRFHLGNAWGLAQNLAKAGTGYGPAGVTFSDATWRSVNLPHDWAVELLFDSKSDGSHGFKPVGPGFPDNSVGWYRRSFNLPATDAGRRLWLQFDGVFRDCSVFVNGWFVGHHESGYSGFRYDITDLANCGGNNVVAVKVDASAFEGWFYEGAGIYRHVWLVKTAPVAVAPDGVFVYSRFKDNIPDGPAEMQVETQIANATSGAADATVAWEISGPDGKIAAHGRQDLAVPVAGAVARTSMQVNAPHLWSPESPRLYTLSTTVLRGGVAIDRVDTEFGIRTFAFDATRGFLLNGKPYTLKGTCNHQDHAGVGAALPEGLQYFRVARLKEMGDNAYRTSHNPPTPELLEACDRLGMLVMDENRLLGSDRANLDRWDSQIRRDRNHASVAIWSIANEEFKTQGTPAGRRVAETMQTLVRRLDPTRPVTYAAPVGNEVAGINEIIEVRGWNYHVGPDMEAYHAAHPQQPNVGTEQASTVSTRGIYANDPARGYVSAYDENAPPWATTAKKWWSYFAARPWLSGGFAWTGFDYRGEPTPYSWPCINSHFGILDTCGFPKDNFWYYQAWWTSQPVLHLLPHWNWAGREGQPIDVRALSNCDEVELFLNGASLGRQTMPRDGELKWSVPYAAGTLAAKGFKDGKVVAEAKVETTGASAAVRLEANRTDLSANGEDVAVVTVSVLDSAGRVVPTAGNQVHFALSGPGRILGVGNGDPSCHEPDVYFSAPSFRAVPIDGWRLKRGPDPYAKLAEFDETFDDASWEKVDVQAPSGPLGLNERGIFRTSFTVSAADLAAPAIELVFGRIEGNATLYVNGTKVAESDDSSSAAIFSVKSLLHPGANTVAVGIANYGASAGLNKGVALRIVHEAPGVEWSRSAFNGLAEVIVQTEKNAGKLTLTATADGLKPATLALNAKPATARPAVQ